MLDTISPALQDSTAARPVRPTRAEAEAAIRTLIRYAGDDPEREGLRDTPARVVRAYAEFFAGYDIDAEALLERTFEEVEGYDEMVLLRDIRVESYCEHHMVPIIGRCHIAYMPARRVVGISKLARLVDAYAKRLQIQERLTTQIADTIQDVLGHVQMTPGDVDLYVPHQANIRIINAACDTLRIPRAKVYANLDRYGNTSAGSIPLALDEALGEGNLKAGQLAVLSGFGAGLAWGTALMRW